MNEQDLKPTPRSRAEKVYDSNLVNFLAIPLLVPLVLGPLSDALGYWSALGIGAVLIAVVSLILNLPVIPLRKRRVARDAEQGIFECSHREPDSALKGRWARGEHRPAGQPLSRAGLLSVSPAGYTRALAAWWHS